MLFKAIFIGRKKFSQIWRDWSWFGAVAWSLEQVKPWEPCFLLLMGIDSGREQCCFLTGIGAGHWEFRFSNEKETCQQVTAFNGDTCTFAVL